MNLYLFQPQYKWKYNNRDIYWLPYSMGSLWAYATQFEDIKQNWTLKELGFQRDKVVDVINRMQDPDLVGFSVYVWNKNYCIALGEAIKQRWPNCIIEVGGPMVNGGWSKYPWVDTIISGEGERSFVEVLRTVAKKQPPELFYKMERMESLSGVPSPYTTGIFDDLIKQFPDYYWNITLETNRGCPYQCTFCDWGGLIASKMKKFDLHRVQEDLEWISQQKVSSIFIADSNFGIFFQRDKEIAKMVRHAADKLGIDYISSNYLKNSDERMLEIAEILGEANKGLTYSVQSMNPATLEVIKRHNLRRDDAKNLFALSTKKKIPFYTELLLGLPLETKESWIDGIIELLEMGQHNRIIVIPVVLLENTELGDIQKDEYGIETIDVLDGLRFSDKEDSGTSETWPWVCATNTMSRQDIIDGFMYGWMITNLHMNNGFSMGLSKYCRNDLNVSYKKFYNEMWQQLHDDADSVVHKQFKLTQQVISEILTKGTTTHSAMGSYNFMDYSSSVLYENRAETYDFCLRIAKSFGPINQRKVENKKDFFV